MSFENLVAELMQQSVVVHVKQACTLIGRVSGLIYEEAHNPLVSPKRVLNEPSERSVFSAMPKGETETQRLWWALCENIQQAHAAFVVRPPMVKYPWQVQKALQEIVAATNSVAYKDGWEPVIKEQVFPPLHSGLMLVYPWLAPRTIGVSACKNAGQADCVVSPVIAKGYCRKCYDRQRYLSKVG